MGQVAAIIVGPLVGIAAILVSLLIYRASRERRRLTYEISATPDLLSVSPEIREEVKVTYQGNPVINLEGVTLTLTNSGNRSAQIPPESEYESPVTLKFGENAEILGNPRIIETIPEDLRASVRIDDDGDVVVNPVLLNPGQGFTVFILLSGTGGRARISAHIKDVELAEVSSATPPSVSRLVSAFALIMLSVVAYYLSVVFGVLSELGDTVIGKSVGPAFLGASIALVFFGVMLVFRVGWVWFGR